MVSSNKPQIKTKKFMSIPDAAKSTLVRHPSLGSLFRSTKSAEHKFNKKTPATILHGIELEKHRHEVQLLREELNYSTLNRDEKPISITYDEQDKFVSVPSIKNEQRPLISQIDSPSLTVTVDTSTHSRKPSVQSIKLGSEIFTKNQSMAHRGRYSCTSNACSISSSRKSRRRKSPASFNVLVIGAESSGKTSFLNFLKTSLALKRRTPRPTDLREDIFAPPYQKFGNFEKHYIETEIDGESVGLSLWDSEGLKKSVIEFQLWEILSFIENKFEETLMQESKVVRAPGIQDTHIHTVFLLLDPLRLDRSIAALKEIHKNNCLNRKYQFSTHSVVGGLDESLDLKVIRALRGKTTVIPVISKADTITAAHMAFLKRNVWESLRRDKLNLLEALGVDEVESDSSSYTDSINDKSVVSDDKNASKVSDKEAPATQNRVHHLRQPSSGSGSRSGSRSNSSSRDRSSEGLSPPEEMPILPLSIISPDIYDPDVIGRQFPWGLADPMNEEHCDFVHLKEYIFSNWRNELRQASREIWYEGWRTNRLERCKLR
ncbi:hypothetical protein K3495_g1950 [Podosphaera aphanis]|nr:hypothetical protein K3495_g1950 [Podosphaera aphanis]